MAKCILDLSGLYNSSAYIFDNAETLLIDSQQTLQDFLQSSTVSGGGRGTLLSSIIIRDPELYPNSPNNEGIMDISEWKNSLLDDTQSNLKKIRTEPIQTIISELVTPSGELPDADGRVSLKNVGGEPCTRGYYGFVEDKVIDVYPIYEMCYVKREPGVYRVPIYAMATRVDSNEVTSYANKRGPLIISDEIAERSGRGKSIVPDLIDPDCLPKPPDPPKKVYKFFANDQDWGIVDLNTKLVKSVTVQNTGEERLVISKYRLSNESDTHFKVVNLNTPVSIEPGSILSFDVEYYPGDEPEVGHTNEIIYAVYEDVPFVNPVFQEKVISKLTGRSGQRDLIEDVEDDLGDWLTGDDNGTYVIKTISRIVDKSAPIQKWETRGLWECAGEKLNSFFTGSNGITNDAHYLSVYNKERGTKNSFHQFDISFGHKDGLGSRYIVNGMDTKPSRVLYKKYLQECYYPNASSVNIKPTKFNFKNGVNGDYVYFIQLDNDDFKDMLDPGNFEICLSPLSGSSNQLINTGSNVQVSQTATSFYTLIDDSWDTKQKQTDEKSITDWYYITSGSLRDGIYSEENDNAWGVVFPKMGLIVLDGVVLDQSCSFNTVTASIDGQNSQKLFLSISGSSAITSARIHTGSFFARSAERKIVETYFCRVGQGEFNYSTNPTYVGGEFGELKYTYFKDNPHSYITTIGLYNKFGNLLAVGKLKNPVLKNNHKSLIFQVRLRLN